MKRALHGLLLGALAVTALEGEAAACGGCFHPPTADAVVTGHRMAFAFSPTRTVLWDQIQYSGTPSEFGWVLPITPGATIEASTDAWFEALDAWTEVQVTAPPLVCVNNTRGGFACGGSDEMALAGSAGDNFNRNVTIIHQGTVGPYETVTLRSTNTGSLRTWLTSHGYVVPADIDPIIDAYVSEGADFIALRLLPGADIDKMTPVRVVTPSGKAILPLRMVQAGTRGTVDIVLYTIAEGRQGLPDLTEVRVDMSQLSFDFAANTSNYLTLRDRALAQNNGVSYVTGFAELNPFSAALGQFSSQYSNLADAYFQQAAQNDGAYSSCPTPPTDSAALVTQDGSSGLAASSFECGPPSKPGAYSDLAAAFTGMHPAKVWLSRLEMRLPREALVMDCNVALDGDQHAVSNQLQAVRATNRSTFCEQPLFESRMAPRAVAPKVAATWTLALFGALGLVRRLRGRRKQ